MTESVSDILLARQRELDSVGRPVAWSFGAHVALIVALAFLPSAWFAAKPEMPTMKISLGAGSPNVKRSGNLSTGGKKVDQVVEPKTREVVLPTAPPKTVTPDPAATVVKTPPKTPEKSPTTPPTTAPAKPATGAKITPGSALVETGAKGLEVGLSSAGGAGTNSAEIDSCCTDYFNEMVGRIDAAWVRNQNAVGDVEVEFIIEKDGKIVGPRVSKKSGVDLLDFAALRAIMALKMGPHPVKYTGQRMFMTFKFTYTR